LLNVFLDDCGFLDQSNDYDIVLYGINGGQILQKLWHQPDLTAPVNLLYNLPFIAVNHMAKMHQDMDLSHLPPALQDKLYNIIREHWLVFDKKGVFVLVKNYEFVIDTRTAWPIAVKKILYGKHKTEIMQKCIVALAKVGHIRQIMVRSWLFKALLAPKPNPTKSISRILITLSGASALTTYP
jgi:hypothetical protein